MRERIEPILKIVCAVLAAVVLYQVFRLGSRKDPLSDLKLPAALETAAEIPSAGKITNAVARQESPKKGNSTPAAVQTRIDRIVQSEILGSIVRPMPMALLGIAGQDAFLRAPSGQTGLLKVGEELGGIKLLRIGTNRVLVEQAGEKKELSVFSGFGSETLLPKGKEASK